MSPLCCCSSVKKMLKSGLKSPPNEEAQGNVQHMRCLNACSFANCARDTAISDYWAREGLGRAILIGAHLG